MVSTFIAENPFVSAVSMTALFVAAAGTGGYVWFNDRRKTIMRQMDELLYKNTATGLYNIRWFRKNAPLLIAADARSRDEERFFVMSVNIERLDLLKEVYDEDTLLKGMRENLVNVRKKYSWISAFCVSQELAMIYALVNLPPEIMPMTAAQCFIDDISTLTIGKATVNFEYVAGIAPVEKNHDGDVKHIMHMASIARGEAAFSGRKIGLYDEKFQENLILQKKMEDLMQKALQNEEFKVWLQPKYDLITRQVIGAEALVRWDSPELGFLMPGKFIGLFERNGFAVQLDYYMLERICQLQVKRQKAGLMLLPISVNQSALHISEEGYLERMKLVLIGYELPPKAVDLELTETAFVDFNTKETRYVAKQIIHDLRGMGYATSMDDFCSGYSSITLLQNLPMETMKIDRALLLAAEKSPRAEIILRGVVSLGQALEMNVICEGIETTEQEELLLRNGCRHGQGYLFGKPMPLEEFEKFVAAKNEQQ